MARPLHSDAPAILSRLQREGVTAFYHFTSVENLPSICQLQALCSKKTLEGVIPIRKLKGNIEMGETS